MNEEYFLARWSRRKREAETPRGAAPSESAAVPVAPPESEVASPEPFDPECLPSIDSITSATDITGFLRAEVPGELTRAALRRAWSSDPVIKNFVGLAENAWDFTDPNAMPGFGPLDLSPEMVRDMVARTFAEVTKAIENLAPEDSDDANRPKTATDASTAALKTPTPGDEIAGQTETVCAGPSEHEIHSGGPDPKPVVLLRRTHGGALPR